MEQFITELQLLAQDCEFHDKNEMVRDRIVFGTNSSKVREKMILEGAKLTLDKAIQIARTHETSQTQLKSMSAENREEHIHSLTQQTKHGDSQKETTAQNLPKQTAPQCGNYGRRHHRSDKYPAKGQICHHCKKPNHFTQVCRSKGRRTQIHPIDNRDNEPSTSQFESITFESITISNINQSKPKTRKDEVFATVSIHLNARTKSQIKDSLKCPAKTSLKAKLDTGAQGNILPIRLYRMMYPQSIDGDGNPQKGVTSTSDTILTAYGGSRIHHHGTVTIDCEFRGKNFTAQFYVTNTQGPVIIGLPTATDLKLIKLNCIIQKQASLPNILPPYTQNPERSPPPKPIKNKEDFIKQFPDCFDGIGKF